MEWSSGHTNSFGSFVLISWKDEDRLLEYSNKVFDEYAAGAPENNRKLFEMYHITRDKDTTTMYQSQKLDGGFSCGDQLKGDTKTKVFGGQVTAAQAHNRPARFRKISNGMKEHGYWKYNQAIPEECRSSQWYSYKNDKYPWILAASSYRVIAHNPADGDISLFEIPENLPAGKYLLHFWWRGYYNCVDVNIVVGKEVTDHWGTAPADNVVNKIDHCQTWSLEYEKEHFNNGVELDQKIALKALVTKSKPIEKESKEKKAAATATLNTKSTTSATTEAADKAAKDVKTKAAAALKAAQTRKKKATNKQPTLEKQEVSIKKQVKTETTNLATAKKNFASSGTTISKMGKEAQSAAKETSAAVSSLNKAVLLSQTAVEASKVSQLPDKAAAASAAISSMLSALKVAYDDANAAKGKLNKALAPIDWKTSIYTSFKDNEKSEKTRETAYASKVKLEKEKTAAVAAGKKELTAATEADTAASAANTKAVNEAKSAASAYTTAKTALKAASTANSAAIKAYDQAFKDYFGTMNRQDWGTNYPYCTIIPKGSNDISACMEKCLANSKSSVGCDSMNVVPWVNPATSAFPGLKSDMIPKQCQDMEVPEDARLCYALNEGRPTDGGQAMSVTTDPEDPVWYSTCYKVQPSAEVTFTGPTCGDPCKIPEDDSLKWRFGNKCVTCEESKKNSVKNKLGAADVDYVPEWTLAADEQCTSC